MITAFWEFLNNHAGILQVFFALVLSIITAIYAYLTHKMVNEMREQNRPYVFLDFEMSEGRFDLSIANIGNRIARNVKFDIARDVIGRKGTKLSDYEIIKNGISYFPPNRRFLFSFDHSHNFFKVNNDNNLVLLFKISYDYNGKKYLDEVRFDLSIYNKGMLFRSFSNIGSVINSGLENIARSIDKTAPTSVLSRITANFGKLDCPICKEMIDSEAKKCHFCGEWIKRSE